MFLPLADAVLALARVITLTNARANTSEISFVIALVPRDQNGLPLEPRSTLFTQPVPTNFLWFAEGVIDAEDADESDDYGRGVSRARDRITRLRVAGSGQLRASSDDGRSINKAVREATGVG